MINANAIQKNWGWFLFLGIIFIMAGTAAIMAPSYVSMGLAWLLGWVLIFAGIFQIIHAFASKAWGGFFLRLLGGMLYLAAGILLETNPLRGALTLTLVLAILLVVQGFTRIINAFQCRHVSAWGWVLMSGVLSILLGMMLYFKWPYSGLWALGLFLGVDLIFDGWTMVMLAFASRKVKALAVS